MPQRDEDRMDSLVSLSERLYEPARDVSTGLLYESHNSREIGAAMNKSIDNSLSDDCVRIKDLGYSSSHHIRLYGQRFDIVSDPFPDGNGVAVEVTTAKEPKKRKLRLPKALLIGLKDLLPKAK